MKKLSKIFESIWSDMQDRGAGDMIKREDDINLLDGEAFAKYLKKLYKNVDTPFKIIFDVENVITVPIIKYKGQTICVHYDCANNIVYGRFDFLYYHDPDLFEKLRKEYKTFMLKKSFSTYVKIEPRVGEFSNEFFIEIIDFYLENCNTTDSNIKRILVKNVNESIWSDMQDRGSGDMIKKEDDIDLLDFDQFYEYLNNRYQTCYTNQNIDRITGSLNYIAVPLLCGRSISQLAIYKDPRIKPYIFMKDVDLYPELLNTFSLNYDITIDDVEKGWKSIYIYTKGKRNQDEKHPNSFYVQLIDYILDMDKPEQLKNMLKRNVNESVWSDMQDRGTGDLEKKEDTIGNSNILKPVDLGGSVYWADKNLEVDGQVLFNYNDTIELIRNLRGWRLPTVKEASELYGHNIYYDPNYIYLDDDRKISFAKDGVGYINPINKPYTVDEGDVFYGWTSEPYGNGSTINVFVIDRNEINVSPDNANAFSAVTQGANSRCSIRLVRSK